MKTLLTLLIILGLWSTAEAASSYKATFLSRHSSHVNILYYGDTPVLNNLGSSGTTVTFTNTGLNFSILDNKTKKVFALNSNQVKQVGNTFYFDDVGWTGNAPFNDFVFTLEEINPTTNPIIDPPPNGPAGGPSGPGGPPGGSGGPTGGSGDPPGGLGNDPPHATPEPSTIILLGSGLLGLLALRARKKG